MYATLVLGVHSLHSYLFKKWILKWTGFLEKRSRAFFLSFTFPTSEPKPGYYNYRVGMWAALRVFHRISRNA